MKKLLANWKFLHGFYCFILLIMSYLLWFVFPSPIEANSNALLNNHIKASAEIIDAYNQEIFKEAYAFSSTYRRVDKLQFLKSAFLIDSVTIAFCKEIVDLQTKKIKFTKETPSKLLQYYQFCSQIDVFFPSKIVYQDKERIAQMLDAINKKVNVIQWEYLDKDTRFSKKQLDIMKNDALQFETMILNYILVHSSGCYNPGTNESYVFLLPNNSDTYKVGEISRFDFSVNKQWPLIKEVFFEVKINDEKPCFLGKDESLRHHFTTIGQHNINVKTYFQRFRKQQFDTLNNTFFVNVKP